MRPLVLVRSSSEDPVAVHCETPAQAAVGCVDLATREVVVAPEADGDHARTRAVEAFEDVVTTLGWAQDTDKIVFAHTHQPLDGVTGRGGRWRYWNTGSWIYEPDLSSKRAYAAYVRNAWPGTAVLVDTDEPHPRLLTLLEHPNPLERPPGRLGS